MKMKLTTRKMAVIGMLGGISIVLGSTPLGFIPIGPIQLTTMHIPVIIGSIVEGPIVGLFIGLIFGAFSMFKAYTQPVGLSIAFMDPIVAIIPRLLIPLVSYYSYRGIKSLFSAEKRKRAIIVGTMVSAGLGTLTNTLGVLGAIYWRYAATFAEVNEIERSLVGNVMLFGIAIPNGIPEAILAILVITPIIQALQRIYKKEI